MKKAGFCLIAAGVVMILLAQIFVHAHKLTVAEEMDVLYEEPAGRYRAGEEVVLKTQILTDTDLECFINGESIGTQTPVKTGDRYTHWEYRFIMPDEAVTVTFQMVNGFFGG